jgi:hypothetical protein
MLTSLRGKDAIVQKLVFEVRYLYGLTYLDHCGRTANAILKSFPEWILQPELVNPQNAPLISTRNACTFNFNALRYELSLERALGKPPLTEQEVKDFANQAENLHGIVAEHLELGEFSRVGFRVWYVFGCGSREEAEEWLRNLGCYKVDDSLLKSFEGRLDASNFAVVIEGEDTKFRIAFNGVENPFVDTGQRDLMIKPHSLPKHQRESLLKQQQLKKRREENPRFAAMIDIDAFRDEPVDIAPKDFITNNLELSGEKLKLAVSKQ